jgi:hypothetical protein
MRLASSSLGRLSGRRCGAAVVVGVRDVGAREIGVCATGFLRFGRARDRARDWKSLGAVTESDCDPPLPEHAAASIAATRKAAIVRPASTRLVYRPETSPHNAGRFLGSKSVGKNAHLMRRMRPFAIVVVIVTIIGVVLLLLAADSAVGTFSVRGHNFRAPKSKRLRTYECGSVLRAKDVRNLVSKRTPNVPAPLLNAYNRCEAQRSKHSRRATILLIAGAALLVAAFTIPAINRARRRQGQRRIYRV